METIRQMYKVHNFVCVKLEKKSGRQEEYYLYVTLNVFIVLEKGISRRNGEDLIQRWNARDTLFERTCQGEGRTG